MTALDEIIANLAQRIHDLEVREEALEAWVTPTLNANWTAGSTPPKYWRSPHGLVYITGRATLAVGAGAVIFTLPAGYRPALAMTFGSTWDATLARQLQFSVRANGDVDYAGVIPTAGVAMSLMGFISIR